MKILSRSFFQFLIFWFLSFGLAFVGFSQSTPGNSATLPRHHSLDQRSIDVLFTQQLAGSTTTGQWTVFVNGSSTGVTVTGVARPTFAYGPSTTLNTNGVSVQFDASGVAGHGATKPYLLPGETLSISYNGNTILTGIAPCLNCPVVPFGPIFSKNTYVPTGAPITGSADVKPASEGPASAPDICSPVNTNFYRWTYAYSLRFRNSNQWVTADHRLNVSWNGPPNTVSAITGYLSDNAGVANTTYVDNSFDAQSNPRVLLTFRAGVNPVTQAVDGTNAAFSYNDNTNICNFRATGFPSGVTAGAPYNGSTVPTMQVAHQFDSYDFDDGNTGALNMNPVVPAIPTVAGVTTSDLVCLGSNVGARFNDVTLFNCIGNGTVLPVPGQGAVNNPINNQQRWVRFIYGGFPAPAPGNIPDIRVAGTPVTHATTGAPLYNSNPILTGQTYPLPTLGTPNPMQDGYVVTGAGGPGIPNVPDGTGVIELPANATAASLQTALITTLSATNQAVGQRFYVTLQYWNVCNPYPLYPPVQISLDWVEIISKPVPLTTAGLARCFDATNSNGGINFTAVSSLGAARTGVNWYKDRASVGTTTKMSNGTNNLTFAAGSYGGQGGIGGAFSTNNTNGRYHSVWATQVVSGTNTCESDPVEIVIIQQPRLNTLAADIPTTPSGAIEVCNGPPGVNEAYTTSAPPTNKTIPITTSTNGAAINLPTETIWSHGFGAGVSLTPTATTGTSTTVTFNLAAQPNPSVTNNVSARRGYITTTNIPVVSPIPAPFTVPTYNINPLACLNNNVDLAVTVYGQSDGGSTAAVTQTICQGATPTTINLTGQRGSVTGWEVQVNGAGGFNVDPALGTGTSLVNPPVPIVGAVQTKYEFRAVVKNGPTCAPARSTIATIIVNPKPISATLTGGATICQGNNTNLVVNIVGGTAPYTVRYSDGTTTFTVNSYVSGSNISVSPASTVTYSLVSVTDAATCIPTTLSGTPTVTVSNPTSAVISPPSQNVCPGFGTDFIVTITGGASPYTVRYRANGGPPVTVSNYNSGDAIPTGVLAATTTYTIEDVRDANNCLSLSNTGSAVVNVGAPLVSATFAGGGNVCRNATANLTLTISGGVAPYHITVTPTAGPVIDNTTYTSGANISVPTTAVGSIDYTVTLITDACGNSLPVASITGNPRTVNVTPVPVASTPKTVAAICSRGNVSVDIFNTSMSTAAGGNNVNSTYTWTAAYPGGITGGPANGTGDIGSTPFTLTNKSGGQLTAVFTVTPRAVTGLCFGTAFVINVPVNSEPVGAVTRTISPAACSNFGFTVDPFATSVSTAGGGNNVTSTYTWTRVLDAGLTLITPGTLSGNIAETIENKTSTAKNATYTVTPTSTVTLCAGDPFTIIVPINPEPVASTPKTTADQCSSVGFSFDPQVVSIATAAGGNNVASNFTWTASYQAGLTGGAPSGTGNIGGTLVNKSGGVLNATYTVTPRAVTGNCLGQNFTIIVPINAEANITTQPVNTPVCVTGATSTGSVSFSVAATGPGITFRWQEKVPAGSFTNLSDGIVGGVTYTGTGSANLSIVGAVIGMNTNEYRVVMTTTGSCTANSNSAILTVNPLPSANNPSVARCSDAPGGNVAVLNLTNFNTNVNSGAGLTFTWWQDAAATASPITPGTIPGQDEARTVSNGEILYARVHNIATGCDNIGAVTFTINTTPVGNPILGPSNVCVSTNTVLYQVATHAGAKYSWNIPAQITVFGGGNGVVAGGGQGPFGNDAYVLLIFPTAATGLSISVTERSAANCDGLPNTKALTIATGPTVVPISGGNSFCKDQKGVVFSVPANATSNFIWTIDGGSNLGGSIVGASAGTGLNQIIVDFKNQSSAQIDVTEINISGCPGVYPPLVVSLIDSPILSPLSTQTICSGDQPSSVIDLDLQASQASTFTWYVKSITANITGAFTNDPGSGPLEHFPPLKNISGTNGTIVYTVTPIASSAPNCVGLPVDYTVIVKPEPVVNTITISPFCPGQSVSIPLSSNVSGAVLNWTSSSPTIGLAAASGSGTISFTAANNLTGVDITSTINVTATANGCTSTGANAKTFVITIKPRPVVDPVTPVVVCPGDAITIPNFTSNTGGGETYAWTNDNTSIGLGGSGSGNIAGFFAPANNTGVNVVGTISVKGTLAGCEGPARTFTITIKPEPVVNAVTNKEFCPGDVINIPLTSNVAGAVISWTNSNTNVGLLASGTGDIGSATTFAAVNNTGAEIVSTINVTASSNSCTSSGTNMKSFTITVKPTPIVDAVTDIVVCSGGTVATTVFGSNITAGGVTFNWTNDNSVILPLSGIGNITSFTAPVNTSGSPMIGHISVTGTKGTCIGPARTFNITVNPEPVVNAVVSTPFCPGDAVSFTLSSNVAGATMNWTNSNPSIGLAGSGTGNISFTAPVNNTGSDIIANINVTATNLTCTSSPTNSKLFSIVIKPTPIVNAVADVPVCSGGTVPTIAFSSNTSGGELYSWTNDNAAIRPLNGTGDITTFTAPVNTSGSSMIANFTVSASRNGCLGPTKTFRIIVNPEPVVAPIVVPQYCAGESINIPLTSNVTGATLSWTNSNPGIGLSPSGNGDIIFIAPANNTGSNITGTINVTASKDGCTSTGANAKSFQIIIKPTPIVNAIPNIVVCSGEPISTIAFGSNVIAGGVTFDWTNDNTGINLGLSGTGNIPGFNAIVNTSSSSIVATISVTGTKNSCAGPAKTFTITVLPQPVGTPTLKPVCSDEAVAVNLNTLITSGASASTYDISIVSNGLVASAGSPVNGLGLSATEIMDDKWTNLTGAAVNVVYSIVPISGSTPNCRGASFDLTIRVNPEPVVAPVTVAPICPATLTNIALSSNVATAAISWTNDNPSIGLGVSGTGSISFTTAANNTGAAIVANITVTASKDGCTSTGANIKTFQITVKPTPIVNTVADVVVCSGVATPNILFSANTGGGESFSWTNDNTTGTGKPATGTGNILAFTPPVNISGVPVIANFTVFATINGCPGPIRTFKVTINPEPVVTAVVPQEFCAGESINIPLLSNVSGAAITWNNDNTAIGIGSSGGGNIVYVAPINNTGVPIVGTIEVFASKDGCTSAGANKKTFTITIKPTPVVNPISNITVCSGSTIGLIPLTSNVTAGGVTFNWTNDNTAIGTLLASGTGDIPSFTAATNTTGSPIVATISVTGTKNSCVGPTRTFTITVDPVPVIDPGLDKSVCSQDVTGLTLGTNGTSVSAISYNIISRNVDPGLVVVTAASIPGGGANGVSSIYVSGDKFKNTTGASLPVTYTVRAVGAIHNCVGPQIVITIMIDPEPVVSTTLNNSVCSNQDINLTLNTNGSSVAAAGWNILNRTIGGGLTVKSIATVPATGVAANYLLTDNFENLTSAAATVTYLVEPVAGLPLQCKGAQRLITITINPEPKGTNFTEPGCTSGVALNHNLQTQITNGVVSVFTYTVTSTNPGVAPEASRVFPGNSSPITHTYTNTTGLSAQIEYTVTAYTSAFTPNCQATTTFKYVVNVDSKPVAGAVPRGPVCSGDTFSYNPQDEINAGNSVPSTFTWSLSYDGGAAVPGSGNVTGTFVNESTGTKNAVFTVTPTASSGSNCQGDPFIITVVVNPRPVMVPVPTNTICSTNTSVSHTTGITLSTTSSSVTPSGYNISVKSIEAGLDGIGTTPDIVGVVGTNLPAATLSLYSYNNILSVPKTVVFTVIPVSSIGGCLGAPIDVTIVVNPEPVLLVPVPAPICSNNTNNPTSTTGILLGTTGTSAPATGTGGYRITNIEYASNPGPIGPFGTTPPTDFTFPVTNRIITSTGGTTLIRDDRFTNRTAFPVVVRYTIVPKSDLGCEGVPGTVSITVQPEPVLDPTLTASICSGDKIDPANTSFELKSLTGKVASSSFIIRSVVLNGAVAASGNAPFNVVLNKDGIDNDSYTYTAGTAPVNVIYTIAPISSSANGSCIGLDQTVTIVINPAPALKPGLDTIVCNDIATGIVLDTAPGSPAANRYNIISVTVPAGLTADAANAGLGITTNTNIIRLDKYHNSTNERITVTYEIVPMSSANCSGPAVLVNVVVEPTSISDSGSVPTNKTQICSGEAVDITFSSPTYSSGNPSITFSYQLVSPIPAGISGYTVGNNLSEGAKISDVLVNSTNAPITVQYRITPKAAAAANGAGCNGTPELVSVTIQPRPKINSIPNKTVCAGDPINLLLTSPTLPNVGVIKFSVTAVPDDATAITGFTTGVLLANNFTLPDALANSDTEPHYVDYTFKAVNVDASDAELCGNGTEITVRITVNPRPVVTPSATTLEICSSESIEVQLPTDTDQSSTLVKWTAVASSVDVVGESNGAGDVLFQTLLNKGTVVQTVDYTITPSFNGCNGNPKHVIVTVNPIPSITVPSKITVCGGNPFNLDLSPLATTAPATTTFKWEVTDINGIGTPGQFDGTGSSINQSIVNSTDASASLLYQITPIFVGTGGVRCEGIPKIINVTVAPAINGAFISADEYICEGTPVFLTFDLQGQAPFEFVYRATDTNGNVVDKTITKSGNVKVEKVTPLVTTEYEIVAIKDALGCAKTLSPMPKVTMTVFKKITAGWVANTPPFISGNSAVGFTNNSNPVDGTTFRYEWTFDTDNSASPMTANGEGPFTVNYNRPGDHYVSMHAVNKLAEAVGQSCESTFAAKITIPVLPLVAAFKSDPSAACFPQNITVTENTSTGDTMDWRVIDSNGRVAATSGAVLPVFLISTPGKYTITLKTSNSLTGQEAFAPSVDVSIYENPVASFDLRPLLVYIPDTELTTFNFSTGAPEYLWDFGDGGTSTEKEPKYTYKVEGKYDVTLIAMYDHEDGAVCTDTLKRQVVAKQGGVTKVPNAFTPSPNGPNGGISGNNTFNDVFLPIVKGAEEFNMQIFDRWGNLIFESNNSTIGWDGYDKNGRLLPAGVYVYKLTLRLSDGQRSTQIGDITMIR